MGAVCPCNLIKDLFKSPNEEVTVVHAMKATQKGYKSCADYIAHLVAFNKGITAGKAFPECFAPKPIPKSTPKPTPKQTPELIVTIPEEPTPKPIVEPTPKPIPKPTPEPKEPTIKPIKSTPEPSIIPSPKHSDTKDKEDNLMPLIGVILGTLALILGVLALILGIIKR